MKVLIGNSKGEEWGVGILTDDKLMIDDHNGGMFDYNGIHPVEFDLGDHCVVTSSVPLIKILSERNIKYCLENSSVAVSTKFPRDVFFLLKQVAAEKKEQHTTLLKKIIKGYVYSDLED